MYANTEPPLVPAHREGVLWEPQRQMEKEHVLQVYSLKIQIDIELNMTNRALSLEYFDLQHLFLFSQ